MSAATDTTPAPTPPGPIEAALLAAVERWNAGDLDGYLRLYAEDVRLHGDTPDAMDERHRPPRRADPALAGRDPATAQRPDLGPVHPIETILRWSRWRRRHQARARRCHYETRTNRLQLRL